MTGETDLILRVLGPVIEQLAQACGYVLAQGYGTITLEFEGGRVKRVLFESSLMPSPPAPLPGGEGCRFDGK